MDFAPKFPLVLLVAFFLQPSFAEPFPVWRERERERRERERERERRREEMRTLLVGTVSFQRQKKFA